MGADIHFIIEKRSSEGEWYGVYSSGGVVTCPAYQFAMGPLVPVVSALGRLKQRNYGFFAEIAGVRGEGPTPLGLPEGLSVMAREEIKRWGPDGHSHSWLYLRDFVMSAIRHNGDIGYAALKALNGKHPALEFLNAPADGIQVDIEDLADFRVVFWFDS